MLYSDEICVSCRLPFKDSGDDVVVCPDCGSPHHRECWKKDGTCANAHLHEEGFVWQPTLAVSKAESGSALEDFVCPVCGDKSREPLSFCPNCGNKIPGQEQTGFGHGSEEGNARSQEPTRLPPFWDAFSERERIGKVSARDLALYVKLGADSYVKKFRKLESGEKKFVWSWPAFFFAPYWFFYRKLYKQGFVFSGLYFSFSLIFSVYFNKVLDLVGPLPAFSDMMAAENEKFLAAFAEYQTPIFLISLPLLLLKIVAALTAVTFYKSKATKEILSLKDFAATTNSPNYEYLLLHKGGTSGLSFFAGYYTLKYLLPYLLSVAIDFFSHS